MAGLTEKGFLDFVAIFRDGKGVNTKACSYRDCVLLQERTGPESNISFQTVILECVSHESRAQVGKYDKRVLVVVVDGGEDTEKELVVGVGEGTYLSECQQINVYSHHVTESSVKRKRGHLVHLKYLIYCLIQTI